MINSYRILLNSLLILPLFIYFLVLPNLSFAANVVLFEETLVRGKGKPNTEQRNFSAVAGEGSLIIHNGDENGENRVSSARIILNGSQIAGPNDFGHQVGLIEKPVVLNLNNTLEVRLMSAPGSFINVQIVLQGNRQNLRFILAFQQFAADLVGHRFTVLSDERDAGGQGICQIDFFRYDSNTLFRARVNLARRRIISTQVVPNTLPAASSTEVAEARRMAEVGALAHRIAETPGLVVSGLGGSGVLHGSSECINDRCIELVYYGSAGTGTAPAAEPLGASFTFTNQELVAIAIVDLTLQVVLHSEVFP